MVSLVGHLVWIWQEQKAPIKEGLSFHLSVHPSSCLSIGFLKIGLFDFSET